MGWRSGTVLDSRLEFVRLAGAGGVSIGELCRRFGVSRQTGHVWLQRYREAGEAGLCDRSSRPRSSPRQTAAAMEERILALRAAHPAWGGRKLVRRLRDQGVAPEDGEVPAASTATGYRSGSTPCESTTQGHGTAASMRRDHPVISAGSPAPAWMAR